MLAASGKKVILLSSVIQTGQFVLPAVPSRTPQFETPGLTVPVFPPVIYCAIPQGALCFWSSGRVCRVFSVTGALAKKEGPHTCS